MCHAASDTGCSSESVCPDINQEMDNPGNDMIKAASCIYDPISENIYVHIELWCKIFSSAAVAIL